MFQKGGIRGEDDKSGVKEKEERGEGTRLEEREGKERGKGEWRRGGRKKDRRGYYI